MKKHSNPLIRRELARYLARKQQSGDNNYPKASFFQSVKLKLVKHRQPICEPTETLDRSLYQTIP